MRLVKPLTYMSMTKRQAAATLEEFLAERPAALEKLRAELTADDPDPDTLLDDTPASLTPLWRWVAPRLMAFEDEETPFAPDDPRPSWWPSWARVAPWLRPTTPDKVVVLLDGMASYLAEVITTHAPSAEWAVAHHRIKRYHLQNHTVLTSPVSGAHVFLPGALAVASNRLRHGLDPLAEDTFTRYALAVIAELQSEPPEEAGEPEPLVEVEYENGVFDLGLREELAHEHSRKVDRMVKELKAQPGITSAYREDREVVLVTAPDWNSQQLEQWVSDWITRHVPAVG